MKASRHLSAHNFTQACITWIYYLLLLSHWALKHSAELSPQETLKMISSAEHMVTLHKLTLTFYEKNILLWHFKSFISYQKMFLKLRAGASTLRFCKSVCLSFCPSFGQKNVKNCQKCVKTCQKSVKTCQNMSKRCKNLSKYVNKDVLFSLMTVLPSKLRNS